MAWYKAYQTLARHPKTLRLARLMKVDRRYAVGLLHDLFSWGLDAAGKYGELIGMEAEDIAAALDMSGKKGVAAVQALMDAGFLDLNGNVYAIHDWYDYSGNLAERREKDRIRKAKDRDGIPQEIRWNSAGRHADIQAQRVDKSKSRVEIDKDNSLSILSEKERKERKKESFPDVQPVPEESSGIDWSKYQLVHPGVPIYK